MEFLQDYEPQLVKDEDDFPKLKGCYVCTITDIQRMEGTSEKTGEPYDFFGMKLTVNETIDGDKGENRRLDLTFNNDEKGLKRLADTLFSAGLGTDLSSQEAMDKTFTEAVGKQVNARTWIWHKEKGDSQSIKIVNEFKKKGKKAEVAPF